MNAPPSSDLVVAFHHLPSLEFAFFLFAWLTPNISDVIFKYQFIRDAISHAQIPILVTLSTLVFSFLALVIT